MTDALALLAALPRVAWACDDWPAARRGDVVPVPWPVALGWRVAPRSHRGLWPAWAAAPVVGVDLGRLWATQAGVTRAGVAAWLADPAAAGWGPDRALSWLGWPDVPWVGLWRGQAFIYDGHHRLMARRLAGHDRAPARLLDLAPALVAAGTVAVQEV